MSMQVLGPDDSFSIDMFCISPSEWNRINLTDRYTNYESMNIEVFFLFCCVIEIHFIDSFDGDGKHRNSVVQKYGELSLIVHSIAHYIDQTNYDCYASMLFACLVDNLLVAGGLVALVVHNNQFMVDGSTARNQ